MKGPSCHRSSFSPLMLERIRWKRTNGKKPTRTPTKIALKTSSSFMVVEATNRASHPLHGITVGLSLLGAYVEAANGDGDQT